MIELYELQKSIEDRERRLVEAVVALAKSLRDERERLARRLAEVERELDVLSRRTAPPSG